jgi:hypothetical protein
MNKFKCLGNLVIRDGDGFEKYETNDGTCKGNNLTTLKTVSQSTNMKLNKMLAKPVVHDRGAWAWGDTNEQKGQT